MAVIMTPANMLPICPMAVKMAVLFAISSGLLGHMSIAGDSMPTS
jgi:hypothetical protein